jgi:alpha-tubulin suppressor-like RCC1 family protein
MMPFHQQQECRNRLHREEWSVLNGRATFFITALFLFFFLLTNGLAAPEVVSWTGTIPEGLSSVPASATNVVAIASGEVNLALRGDGTVVSWPSYDGAPYTPVPEFVSNIVAIAAGAYHNIGLRNNGTVVAWRGSEALDVPPGLTNVVAIRAGHNHSVALKADGHIVTWGFPGGEVYPLGNVLMAAAGGNHTLVLQAGSELTGWPMSSTVGDIAPHGLSNVIAISTTFSNRYAVLANGRMLAWGYDETLPAKTNSYAELSNVVDVAARGVFALFLQSDGRVVGEAGLSNVVALVAGGNNLAVIGRPPGTAPPAFMGSPFLIATADYPFFYRTVVKNGPASFYARGLPAGLKIDPSTGLVSGTPKEPGNYPIILAATNTVGGAERAVTLFVNAAVPIIRNAGIFMAGIGVNFTNPVLSFNNPDSVSALGLPSGLGINPVTGVISGIPTQLGQFEVALAASNRFGIGTGALTIRVSPVLSWSDDGISDWHVIPENLADPTQVSAGLDYDFMLQSNGQVFAWNHYGGQSGVLEGLENIVDLQTRGFQSLALRSDGRVLALTSDWTSNYQLTNFALPITNAIAIAGGSMENLALLRNGRVLEWKLPFSLQTNVPTFISNAVAISRGDAHSLVLLADGRLIAWGDNTGGQTNIPKGLSNIVAISAGGAHNLALSSYGRVFAWGSSDYGQTEVPSTLSNVVAIQAGWLQDFALCADGRIVVWGTDGAANRLNEIHNAVGLSSAINHLALLSFPRNQAPPELLGNHSLAAGAGQKFFYRPIVRNGAEFFAARGLPAGISIDPQTGIITGTPLQNGVFTIVLAATNSMGGTEQTFTLYVNGGPPLILTGGLVLTGLGAEFNYPLETVNTPREFAATGLPQGLAIERATGIIQDKPLATGDFPVYLSCSNDFGAATGLVTIRVSPVLAWGANWAGQSEIPPGLSNIVGIAGGTWGSLALGANGKLIGWGETQNNPPETLSNVVAVACGFIHSLALSADGNVFAWGNDSRATNIPVAVSNIVGIAAGIHSLALRADGRVFGWGENFHGQAAPPSSLSNVVAIAAGDNHSLALCGDGRVVAWGDNSYGQSGVPAGLSNVIAIAAGGEQSMALQKAGRIIAWGVTNFYSSEQQPDRFLMSNIVSISAGENLGMALTAEKRIVEWGNNGGFNGSWLNPGGLSNVVSAIAGRYNRLVLLDTSPEVAVPEIIEPPFLIGEVGHPFFHRMIAKNGPTSFYAHGLPNGLAINQTTGVIEGVPAQPGMFNVIVAMTNSVGGSQKNFTLNLNGNAIAQPTLTISRSGQLAVLSWPASFTNYTVEAAAELSISNWECLCYPPTLVGSRAFLTNTIQGPARYFRLAR